MVLSIAPVPLLNFFSAQLAEEDPYNIKVLFLVNTDIVLVTESPVSTINPETSSPTPNSAAPVITLHWFGYIILECCIDPLS